MTLRRPVMRTVGRTAVIAGTEFAEQKTRILGEV
jgi:hypothetical protein